LQEYTIQIKLKWDGGKNYPEYFAKVLNAPNWIGIDIEINGESLDLNTCTA
jgi:maltose phosphorylase